jgi:hypothetical protein
MLVIAVAVVASIIFLAWVKVRRQRKASSQ